MSFAIQSVFLVPVTSAIRHHVRHSLLLYSQIHSEKGEIFISSLHGYYIIIV